MDNRILLLLLSLIPGIGPARIKAIAGHLHNLTDLLHCGTHELQNIAGIGLPLARQMHDFLHHDARKEAALRAAEEQLESLERCHATLVTMLDPEYPPLLKELFDPPVCLFVRGKLPGPATPALAVVGTRDASPYGRQSTELLVGDLVRNGIAVISGLAFGIDMAAHAAALQNGGLTVAVLATGVERIYTDPKGKLWPKIVEQGAIISEEWIGSELSAGKFPKRNRIISGLSSGTLVVESDLKGGALITATYALEQNREVFALPGSIFSRTSRGTNRLIQQGQAKAVMSSEDIIAELWPQFLKSVDAKSVVRQIETPELLTEHERNIVKQMGRESMHIDALAAVTGIEVSSLLVSLFELELKGAVRQEPGQFFQRTAR